LNAEGRIALWALGRPGAELCRRLAPALGSCELFLPRRLARPEAGERPFDGLAQGLEDNFRRYAGHVAVCAAGMVVRAIAPLLRAKDQDPAVVVVDQLGQWAVSLVSGHLGGANELARRVAGALGGQAVITTATDGLNLPSLEMEAKALGLVVENLAALAGLSAALIDGRAAPVHDPGGWLRPLTERRPELFVMVDETAAQGLADQPLAWVDWREPRPPKPWLVLRPPALALGVGCNRGAAADEIIGLIDQALAQAGLSRRCLARLASAQAKADEPGLLEAARRLGLEPIFYAHERLAEVATPNQSAAALRCLGTASVCEAAAILAAGGGELLWPKTKTRNCTVAVALICPENSMS